MPISILESVVAVGAASLVSILVFHFVKAWWIPLGILGVFWATGIVVGPLTNHTFIQPADVFDTSELHHDQIVVELARVEDIGRLDEGVIRERADHDARRPEHAEDPQGYPPCLHKMENENANEGGRAHRNDGFEDRNWHRGLRCSVTLSAFRISPPPIESNRHIFDEETASAGTEQAANDT